MSLEDSNGNIISQLVLEVRALSAQNHKEHAEIKESGSKDREWSEKRFDQLFNKADDHNVRIAQNETKVDIQNDRVQTLDVKIDKINKILPAIETDTKNSTWFIKVLIVMFILQIIAAMVIKAL